MKEIKIPNNWLFCRMQEIASIYNGNSISEEIKLRNFTGLTGGYNYIATKDIGFDSIINYENGVKIPFTRKDFKIAPKNTPLLCIEGGSAGRKLGFLSEDVCFGNKLCAFVSPFPRWIYYYLQSHSFRNHFNTNKNGLIGGVSINKLKQSSIPVPPMAEQKRIVKKIEELFGVIDEQVKRLEATHAALVSYRQSILQQAFSGKLYKTSTWEEVPLKKCCLPVIKRKDSKDPSEKFLYLDIASIDNKTNKIIEGTPYRGDTAPSRARQIVQKDDILFSTVRTYLKNIALITASKYDNQIASTGFCVIRANQKMLLPHFIFYKTLSDAFLSSLNAKQRGSSYPAVRNGDVLSSIIDLPSLPDQKAIVKKIETAFAFADKAQAAIIGALEQAKQLKQSILKRAFEGKLVLQDPNDKPVDLTQLKKDKHK